MADKCIEILKERLAEAVAYEERKKRAVVPVDSLREKQEILATLYRARRE